MILIQINEGSLKHSVDIEGDVTFNAKQLAQVMNHNPEFAKAMAMAIPWYNYLNGEGSKLYAEKTMEVLQDEFEEFFESAIRNTY